MRGSGIENSFVGRSIDFLYHLMAIPGRSIIAIDQFAKTLQYRMSMSAMAYRQGLAEATEQGLVGAEKTAMMQQLSQRYVQTPLQWMLNQAEKDMRVNTFSEALDGSLADLDKLRQGSFMGRTLFPFMKTPINITLQGIRQSPRSAI